MGQEPYIELPDGLLELKEALEAEWPARRDALHAAGVPLAEGDDDGDGDGEGDDSGDGDGDDSGGGDDGDEGKTFDATYVKKLRDEAAKHRREAKEAKARAKEFEDQNKTEAEKLAERAAEAEKRATAAEATNLRFEVALDKAPEGMTVAQVRKLAKRLAGSTKEELEADAEELFAEFTPDDDRRPAASGRPRERLRPGAAPSADLDETDPAKLAAKVRRPYDVT